MSKMENNMAIQENLNKFGITGVLTFTHTLTSAVTTSWGVGWDEEFIARDLMQNFYDANRDCIEEIKVKSDAQTVMVSAPSKFNLSRLFYLGSEKGSESVGQYGEGFKAAAVCLLRDHGVSPIAVSGNDVVVLRISDEKVTGTDLNPVVYDFYTLDSEHHGTALILPNCSTKLTAEMQVGLTHFFYEKNELLGALRWTDSKFSIYDSKTNVGHVFYQNLKRGVIEGIPVILVINKEYQNIERKVSKDRDRNAFGEELMELFYKVFANNGIKNDRRAQEVIISAARQCWTKGHALLHAIYGTFGWNQYWDAAIAKRIFGDGYCARAAAVKDPALKISIESLERTWQEQGKVMLPGYFSRFGVMSADREIQRSHDLCQKEDQKQNRREPTRLELDSLDLLKEVLKVMAPAVVTVFAKSTTSYLVILSTRILGELKSGRNYRSREVFLSDVLFVGDFAAGMATYLHEHAHIFGHDGDRGFTDALTEMLESVVRHRDQFDAFESKWNICRSAIQNERQNLAPKVDETKDWLNNLDDQSIRALLLQVPESTLKRIRESNDKLAVH